MNTKKTKAAVPSNSSTPPPVHPDFQPPANVLILCQVCKKPLKFFCYIGRGHERSAVWYCDEKDCKVFHIFIYNHKLIDERH